MEFYFDNVARFKHHFENFQNYLGRAQNLCPHGSIQQLKVFFVVSRLRAVLLCQVIYLSPYNNTKQTIPTLQTGFYNGDHLRGNYFF